MEATVRKAVRYVTPLREGGSLPAVVEAEDGSLWVAKFRGAGQGAPVLAAEIIAETLARSLGLPVPEVSVLELEEGFGRTERDPEIRDLLTASVGLNTGMTYLEGAFNFSPVADGPYISPELAALVVWFDAFITNIDRTPRNPNLMIWNDAVYLIDHGSALYFHFNWPSVTEDTGRSPFPAIRNHVLLPAAGDLQAARRHAHDVLDARLFQEALDRVPDALLMDAPAGRTPPFETAELHRAAYVAYFRNRLNASNVFTEEAVRARDAARNARLTRLPYRR